MEAKESPTALISKLVDKTNSSSTNSRKCPAVIFMENVSDWVNKYGADNIIQVLNEYLNKFKYMEAQVIRHIDGVKQKIPDLEKALDTIAFLEKKQKGTTLNIDYMVSNNLWAKSDITIGDTVYLWLGADIMCEYTMSEAKEVLHSNLEKARTNIKIDERDLDFLRDQITVCEVNISRTYNENVKRTKAQAKKAAASK